MRISHAESSNNTKILLLDDEEGIIDSLSVILKKSGYHTEGVTSPLEAISKLQEEQFDILILDFLMYPIHGDKVVEKVRQFNSDIYIILLTGHKDLVPPLETIRNLQIQAYCEKSDSFDQLLLLVESGRKTVSHTLELSQYQQGVNKIIDFIPKMYQVQTIENMLQEIVLNVKGFANIENAFICIYDPFNNKNIVKGIGQFSGGLKSLNTDMLNNLEKSRSSKYVFTSENGTWFPLINDIDACGVLYLEYENNETNNKLIDIFVKQVSSFINFALLQSLMKMRNSELAAHYEEDKNEFSQLIDIFKMLVEKRDKSMVGHCQRVSYYATKIGETMELEKDKLEILKYSGLLHDIFQDGDIDDIYEEKNNDHVLEIRETLEQMSAFKEIGSVIENHHERLDGSGYPNGSKDKDIPFLSKIIAVSDAFDVLNSEHTGMDEIKEELTKGKNTLFDASVVDIFIGLLEDYYLMEEDLQGTY